MKTFRKTDIRNMSLSEAYKRPAMTVIMNESQLGVIREYEKDKVLRYEFESKVRDYMEELRTNPCKPKYDSFFTSHGISEDVLQDKMSDLGLISKTDKITEPEDAKGKKHSVHTRKFIFSSSDFDDKMGKLYDHFFKGGVRSINETDCGGIGGGAGGFDANEPGGATTTHSTGNYTYDVPFGGVQRRKIGTSRKKKNDDITDQDSNIDMSDALDRTPGKIAVNRVNESIYEHKGLSNIADEEFYDIKAEFLDRYKEDNYTDISFCDVNGVKGPCKIFEVDGYYCEQYDNNGNPTKKVAVNGGMLESAICVIFEVFELTDKDRNLYYRYLSHNPITSQNGTIYLTCYSVNGILDENSLAKALKALPHEQIHGIQNTKSKNSTINPNYQLAKNIRNGKQKASSGVDYLISQAFWYFDKQEIDANIHKFIVDYRDLFTKGVKFSETEFYYVILQMSNLYTKLLNSNEKELNDCLLKYNIKRPKFLKHCNKMLNYANKEFKNAIENIKKGEYPYPKSRSKY